MTTCGNILQCQNMSKPLVTHCAGFSGASERASKPPSDALGVVPRLQLEISVIKVPHDEGSYRCRRAEPSRDVIPRDNVRLQVGWEGENWYPGGEDVSECVHLEYLSIDQLTAGTRTLGG